MSERHQVVVVGGGPAGLALSYELGRSGLDHVVLERGRVGQSWRTRWESFCLVTPNWTVALPGGAYDGGDPNGFMPRDHIVAHMERYATSFGAPLREGVAVTSLQASSADGGFVLETSEGAIDTRTVVLATGAFQKAHRPPAASSLPTALHVIDSEQYASPRGLPDGGVLVVGSGQTGCQIAEELNEAGRHVAVACGKAPWGPRRVEGRDLVAWVADTPFLEQTLADLPSPLARLAANFQATGRNGGHDLHYRTLQAGGVTLTGRLQGATDRVLRFAQDLHESVAWGDARYGDLRTLLTKTSEARGERPPELPEPEPFKADPPDELNVSDFGTVIFTSGYRPDYDSWVHLPGAFDEMGFPVQSDGASTVTPGLYFMGTHFLRKRKSSTLYGMGEDAAVVAEAIAARA